MPPPRSSSSSRSLLAGKRAVPNQYWHNIDPFDASGQICDKGDPSYRTVILRSGWRRPRPTTLGGHFDVDNLVNELRSMNVTPHVAQNTSNRRSATTWHGSYVASQRIRRRTEEAFGWIKTVAGQENTRFQGVARVGLAFTFAAAAYNLIGLPKLLGGANMIVADHPLIVTSADGASSKPIHRRNRSMGS
jgi:hypothetical protein